MNATVSDAVVSIAPLGDRALVVTLGERIGDEAFQRVRTVLDRLEGAHPAITELVAGFVSVTVHYDPAVLARASAELPHAALSHVVEERLEHLEALAPPESRLVEIPACYAADLAPDLDAVAAHARIATDDVIALHCAASYRVHMIGFSPGFPYLAGLDPRLATPRRAAPRTRVPVGSIGIGGEQTGIYPSATPGGWNLIGRTPLAMFDVNRDPAALLRVGDRVRFVSISREQFDAAARE